jgi:membrane AbrB-like protein
VALAQTLRLSLAVLTIPFLLLALEPATAATALPPSAAVPPAPSALVALALAGPAGALLHRAGMANAFFIGALVGVGALAVTGLVRAPLPGGLVAGGQVLLGVSLGGMLRPQVLVGLGRDLRLVASFSVLLLGLGVALGSVLAALGVAPFGAMILATSAGGVAEMSIAAAAFGHDPAYVSAYHLVRIFIIVPLAEPLLRLVP